MTTYLMQRPFSLGRLPFDDNQFDFVRMVRVGFHVPVDEVRIRHYPPFPFSC